jgi:hypothetical protein
MDNFKEFTIEYFILKAEKLQINSDTHYLRVYHHLIDFVKSIELYDHKAFVSIAHMVYGWMPTILECNFSSDDNYSMYIKNINSGDCSIEFLNIMKSKINNSIVGGSKFLHFINPEKYAIWDSKVYKSLFGKKGNNNSINNIKNYIQYNLHLRELCQKEEMDRIYSILTEKKYIIERVSKMRALENVLFYSIE